jgi:hypothetical protein
MFFTYPKSNEHLIKWDTIFGFAVLQINGIHILGGCGIDPLMLDNLQADFYFFIPPHSPVPKEFFSCVSSA